MYIKQAADISCVTDSPTPSQITNVLTYFNTGITQCLIVLNTRKSTLLFKNVQFTSNNIPLYLKFSYFLIAILIKNNKCF